MDNDAWLHDISSQFNAQLRLQQEIEATELAQADAVEVAFSGRLLGSVDCPVTVFFCNGQSLQGRIARAAVNWIIVQSPRDDVLIWRQGIDAIQGLELAPQWPTEVEQRLTPASVLRQFAQRLQIMSFHTRSKTFLGKIVRVGHDFVDIEDCGRITVLPLDALVSVSCPRQGRRVRV